MIQFESLSTVFHSPSIVTMVVYLTILEIFSVKEWPDVDIWVWGLSRSLKMTRIDRPYMTFYWSATVTRPIAPSCTISSYFTLNNIVTLKFGLRVTRGHLYFYLIYVIFFATM